MEKTPQQAEKEAQQKAWEEEVKNTLDLITMEIPNLDTKDVYNRASIYRSLVAVKLRIAQCSPEVRKAYNKAIDALYSEMDAVPSSMYLDESVPKP